MDGQNQQKFMEKCLNADQIFYLNIKLFDLIFNKTAIVGCFSVIKP